MLRDSQPSLLEETVSRNLVGEDTFHDLAIEVFDRPILYVEGGFVSGHLGDVLVCDSPVETDNHLGAFVQDLPVLVAAEEPELVRVCIEVASPGGDAHGP